jgi:putative serine protease PepD
MTQEPLEPAAVPVHDAHVGDAEAETFAEPVAPDEVPAEPERGAFTPTAEDFAMGRAAVLQAGRTRQPRWLIRPSLAITMALLAGITGGVVDHAFLDKGSTGSALTQLAAASSERPAGSIAALAAAVTPSVVALQVNGWQGSATGSGFIIRSDGYILTNHHVVSGVGASPKIEVVFADGSKVSGTVVGSNTSYDLAVVKVDKTGLPAVTLGNSDGVVVGDPVLAIGSPLGLQGTVTSGIVSALNRPVTTDDGSGVTSSYIDAIQTDAAINPGNSGGPLIDGQGAVIGVNSAIASMGSSQSSQTGSIGLGFAIPVNQAKRIATEIMKTGSSRVPVMGVSIDMTYKGEGALIAKVVAGGGAAKAGLKASAIITKIDGDSVADATELIVAIRAHQPGDVMVVTTKNGKTFNVTLGADTSTN